MIVCRATSRPGLMQRPAWREQESAALAPRKALMADPRRAGRVAAHAARVQAELAALAERAALSDTPEIARSREALRLYRQQCKAKKQGATA